MESINNLEKALSSDKLDFKERILYQNEKGYIKYRLGEFEEARLIIEKSLSLLEENNFTDSELSGDTLHLLSKVQNKLNHEVTINTLEKARNIFHSLKSFNKLLEINNTMAVYYENRGKPSASLPYCEDNIKKLEKSKEGNLPELAKCYGIMSRCLFLMGKFIESLDYKQKDLEIVKTIGDKRETAKLYNEIADSLILTGKLDEAGKYLELAEEEYETSCDKFGKAHLLNIKAKLYLKENKFKEALGLCGEAIDIYESMNLTLNIQEVNILRGRIYGIQGRVEEGEKLLEEALNILGKYKYESGLISYELALISKNKGKYYLGRAREIFEDMKNEYWIERLNEIKI
jgi:tetratricopeptide (TPR) repeat protein